MHTVAVTKDFIARHFHDVVIQPRFIPIKDQSKLNYIFCGQIQCLFSRDGSDDKKLPALLREK